VRSLLTAGREPRAALAGLLAAVAAVVVLVVVALYRPGHRDHTDELVSSLLAPTVDKTTILVRVVLLVASAAVAGLALARVLTGRRSEDGAVGTQPGSAGTTSGESFAAMFADLSASVSVAVPAGSPDHPSTDTPARAAATGDVRRYAQVSPEARAVAWVGGLAVAAACVAAAATGQASRPVAAAQLALALAVPLLISDRRRVWPVGVVGLALVGMLGVEFSAGRSGLPLALDVIYAVGGSALLGTLVFAATRPPGSGGAGDRLGPLAVVSGVLVTAVGTAQLLITGPRTLFDLLHTGYGLAALGQAVLPALVTAVWVFATCPRGRPRAARLSRLAAGGLTFALLAAAMVATFPLPLPAPEPGQPLLRPVNLGLRHLAVLVLPMRPGPNLVHIGSIGTAGSGQVPSEHQHGAPQPPAVPGRIMISVGSAAGVPGVPLTARPGTPGTWAVLDIPAGTDKLTITGDGITATVPVDVGTTIGDPAVQAAMTGPDGPECASAVLGGLLAGGGSGPDLTRATPVVCPSQSLSGRDGGSLRDTVAFLAGRGIRALEVVSDGSPRGLAAAELVRAEASRRHLPISDSPSAGDTLLLVSGWSVAKTALDRATVQAVGTPGGGIVLAPWLLTGGILSAASSEVLPLTFNPQDLDPRQYASAVSSVFPGETPSTAGYLAWATRHGSPLDPRATFYGAAPVNVPMGMDDDMDMGSEPSDWYPGGTVVPINPPLTTPASG
jgi:hypothetical protein